MDKHIDMFEILVPGYKEKSNVWFENERTLDGVTANTDEIIASIKKADIDRVFALNQYDRTKFYQVFNQIWEKPIKSSCLLYEMICETMSGINDLSADMEHIFEYVCLSIVSNGIRIFASITELIKTGYLHGAIALCRTLEEESIILDFIVRKGKTAALDYYKAKDGDLKSRDDYDWAKPFLERHGENAKSKVSLNELRQICFSNIGSEDAIKYLNEAYRFMCKFSHSSPQTVFNDWECETNELGIGPSTRGFSCPGFLSAYYIGQMLLSLLETTIMHDVKDKTIICVSWSCYIQQEYTETEQKLISLLE